jgi:hypothetical protein
MLNISLPNQSAQEMLYLKQLTVNVFGNPDMKYKAIPYIYHEDKPRKGYKEE